MIPKIFAFSAALVVIAPVNDGRAEQTTALRAAQPPATSRQTEVTRPKFPTIHVTDMHCKHCGQRLARKLFTVPGVKRVRANIAKDIAIVEPQKDKTISPLQLWEAAEAAKFQVVKIETPTNTYEKKPVELGETSSAARPATQLR